MSENLQVRALALREAGVKQKDVAERIGVSVKTIRRLEQRANGMKPGEAPGRKPGTGKKKSYGYKEVAAIRRAWKKNPKITCTQLLIRMPKTLGHLSRRVVNTILMQEIGKCSVSATKPFLSDSQRERKLKWAIGHRFWGNSRWRRYFFADETYFCTKNQTGGRLVRREKGSSRFDPRYTQNPYNHPQKLMAWCGISSEGHRILHFLGENETMTSARYVSTLKNSGALEMMKKAGLRLYHDKATVHRAGCVNDLLKKSGVRSKMSPGTSPDLMPVENAFARVKQLLESRPTKTLAQSRAEVRRAWNSLPDSDLATLSNSMPDRINDTIRSGGNPIGY